MIHRNTWKFLFGALTLLALSGFCRPAHAADEKVLSAKRLSITAQFGAEWERPTDNGIQAQRFPEVKLVPVYRVWGPANGHEGGSVAFVFPVTYGLDSNHLLRGGAFLSVCIWSGADK